MSVVQFKSKLSPNEYGMLMYANELKTQIWMQSILDIAKSIKYVLFKNSEEIRTFTSPNKAIQYLSRRTNLKCTMITSSQNPSDLIIRCGEDCYHLVRTKG